MKKRDILGRFLLSFLCGAALAIGNLFCILTAFDIPVDTKLLIILCLSSSLLFSAAFIFKRGWIGVSLVGGLIIWLVLYNWSAVVNSYAFTAGVIAEQFLLTFNPYSQLTIITTVPFGTTATAFMALLGAILAFITVITISKRCSLFPLALISTLLLSLCLIILDYIPDAWSFVLLIGVYALLILTQSRRKKSTNGQYLFSLGLALPVMLFMIVVLNAVQPDSYVPSDWLLDVRDEFKAAAESNPLLTRDEVTGEIQFISPIVQETLGNVIWNEDVSKTDLSKIGPQGQTGIPVMSVYSDKDKLYYLKGYSLAVYEDNGWLAPKADDYANIPINEKLWLTNSPARERIEIKTNIRSKTLYLPYTPTVMPASGKIYYDSYVLNTDNTTEYAVSLTANSPSAEISPEYEEFVHQTYTQVPDDTRMALSTITEQLTEKVLMEYDRTAVDIVAEYVRQSATYDLNTPQMPSDEDFVRWFLEDSDTGYCVHFATAATVLLRCMDIPARYVNGYLVNTDGNGWNTVTQDDAHAWVEFYMDGYGWRMIDPTPASLENNTEITPSDDVEAPEFTPVTPNEQTENTTIQNKKTPFCICIITAAIAIIVLWCPVLRRIREQVLRKGTNNERAAKYYRRILFLSKISKSAVDENTETLAMKARFSQYLLTEDELNAIFESYRELCLKLRAEKALHKFVLYHYILALPKTFILKLHQITTKHL